MCFWSRLDLEEEKEIRAQRRSLVLQEVSNSAVWSALQGCPSKKAETYHDEFEMEVLDLGSKFWKSTISGSTCFGRISDGPTDWANCDSKKLKSLFKKNWIEQHRREYRHINRQKNTRERSGVHLYCKCS